MADLYIASIAHGLGYPESVVLEFLEWMDAEPQIYDEFKKAAWKAKRAGNDVYGARGIVEQIRWEHKVKKRSQLPFLINDDYVPIMARLLMIQEPRLKGLFNLRAVKSKGIRSEEQRKRESEAK